MSRSSRINPAEIIDVDALPEWNHSRRVLQHTSQSKSMTTSTIDLTNMDDSDSDISILSSTTKPNGKGNEMSVEKIRKRSRPNASSHPHSQTSLPPAKKLKLSTPPSASRERPTSVKLANGSGRNINTNHNEPVTSTSTTTKISKLSLSDVSLILSQEQISQAELTKVAQTMMSPLQSLPPSSSPATMMAVSSNVSHRRKDKGKRTIACIELSSDDEDVVEFVYPKKKRKATSSPNSEPIAGPSTIIDFKDSDLDPDPDEDVGSDEDSYYDYIHAGYDINDPDIWTPMPTNPNKLQEREEEREIIDNMKHLAISKYVSPRYVHPDISRWYPSKITFPPIFIWDRLRLAIRYPSRPRPMFLQPLNKPFTRPWDLDFNLHRLKAVHSFKESPGSINRIEQKEGWTVITSACTGGLPDIEGEELSPYNRPGSLITWRNRLNIPDGHRIRKGDKMKYYAVHDLKFFPNKMSFVSSGADGVIRLWNLPSDGEDGVQSDEWFNQRLKTFTTSPHDLAFKPDTSILAIAERKIHVFTFRDDEFDISADFSLYSSRSGHVIGSLAWGRESTADQLFGSSEPCHPTVFEGIHKALDVRTKKSLYQFDASEAGDMLSVDATGATLALSTRAAKNKHLLRIYDTRRGLPKATHLMELEPFPIRDDFEGEVNNSSFSPDGMYLALARNDNRTHVYDRRMWDRGVLFEYAHDGESKAASQKELYGVVKAQWVQSQATRRMALITGGEDGCVRMWDPAKAAENPNNGKVLAEVNSDIGHFSLGDPYTGENQLVVGDNTGEVTIFNNVVI